MFEWIDRLLSLPDTQSFGYSRPCLSRSSSGSSLEWNKGNWIEDWMGFLSYISFRLPLLLVVVVDDVIAVFNTRHVR